MGFKLEGMNELLTQLAQMGDKANSVKEKATLEGAKIIRDEIEKNAPRSNYSKEHAADQIIIGDFDSSTNSREIGTDKESWYLQFPEWGTSTQPAQAFTEKSFNVSKDRALEKVAQIIMKELKL